jgi:hypothetical protein
VWVGFYDVCNSAGPWADVNALGVLNSGIGSVLNQAITDLTPTLGTGNGETFVDGYGGGSTLVTINGFHLGPQPTPGVGPSAGLGDTIVFGVADWARGVVGNQTVRGLVESDGHTGVNNSGSQSFSSAAIFAGVGTQGAIASVTPPNNATGTAGNVVLDSINGAYNNAAAFQNAIGNDSIGSFKLTDGGVPAHTTVDILVAYNLSAGGIAIADVTLTNTTGGALVDTANLSPVVHNLVVINPTVTNVGLGNFDAHNIWFTA